MVILPLRLPPYHQLNPIKLVRPSSKQYVAERNVNFSLTTVERLYHEFFSTFSEQKWKTRCDNVKGFKQSFMERKPALEFGSRRGDE